MNWVPRTKTAPGVTWMRPLGRSRLAGAMQRQAPKSSLMKHLMNLSSRAAPRPAIAPYALAGKYSRNHTKEKRMLIGPIVALIAGILILFMPRLLNYIVALYLIIVGLLGL